MNKFLCSLVVAITLLICLPSVCAAQNSEVGTKKIIKLYPSIVPTLSPTISVTPAPKPDLTEGGAETLGPLEELLKKQTIDSHYLLNPIKYAIRGAIKAGIPANTIVLLLLLPAIAMVIAAGRHIIGIRGFGIFLPAALSVVFVATGPILGLLLFLVIVVVSTLTRWGMRKLDLNLQYLPRMALILWIVSISVLGILFASPVIKIPELTKVSIFPILVITLLAEDFIRVQIGKSVKTAIKLTSETLILALVSFVCLTLKPLQEIALLNPEAFLFSILIIDLLLGKYVGLRLMEIWRFRKLINK